MHDGSLKEVIFLWKCAKCTGFFKTKFIGVDRIRFLYSIQKKYYSVAVVKRNK